MGTIPLIQEPEPIGEGPTPGGSASGIDQAGGAQSLRAALFPAALAAFLASIPLLNLLCFIWYPAAGFLTVFGFKRRIGGTPSVRKGAALGAVAGLLSFVISLSVSALGFLLAGSGEVMEAIRKQAEQIGGAEAVARVLENPVWLSLSLLIGLLVQCALSVGLCSLGGAMAAKVLDDSD